MSEALHVVDDLAEILIAQALREVRRLIRGAVDVGRDSA